jgi:hypothetical protein
MCTLPGSGCSLNHEERQNVNKIPVDHDFDRVLSKLSDREHHERINIDMAAVTIVRSLDGDIYDLAFQNFPATRGTDAYLMGEVLSTTPAPLGYYKEKRVLNRKRLRKDIVELTDDGRLPIGVYRGIVAQM